jgi:hypothetical protein
VNVIDKTTLKNEKEMLLASPICQKEKTIGMLELESVMGVWGWWPHQGNG